MAGGTVNWCSNYRNQYGGCQHVQVWWHCSPGWLALACRRLPSVPSHGLSLVDAHGGRGGKLASVSSYKCAKPFIGAPPSGLIWSWFAHKGPTHKFIPLGVSASTYEFGGIQTLSPYQIYNIYYLYITYDYTIHIKLILRILSSRK